MNEEYENNFGQTPAEPETNVPQPAEPDAPVAPTEEPVTAETPATPETPETAEPAPQEPAKEFRAEDYAHYRTDEPQQAAYEPQQNRNPYSQTQYGAPTQGQTPYMNYSPYAQQTTQPVQEFKEPPKKKRTGVRIIALILAAALCIGVFYMGKVAGSHNSAKPASNGESTTTKKDDSAPEEFVTQKSGSSETTYKEGDVLTPSQIAAKASPSVVVILTYKNDVLAGSGSGVLWQQSKDGKYTYVITCAHVVSAAGIKVKVQLSDESTYEVIANGVSYDEKTDLAVLKIEAGNLPLADFGDSDSLHVGDPVYAIGSPGGAEYSNSFTAGYVSAIDRSVTGSYTMEYIQHDAAINPGNSGGALVNQYGQVVGINSMKIVDEQYEGMGFAIPIGSARDIVKNLAILGYVPNRPKLGISYTNVSASWMYSMIVSMKGLPQGSLIIANDITPESALYGTEAQKYDLITEVNGEKLETATVLLDKIEKSQVGDKLTLKLARVVDNNYNIKEFTIEVTLIEDKGTESKEETTTSGYSFNPYNFDGFENFFN